MGSSIGYCVIQIYPSHIPYPKPQPLAPPIRYRATASDKTLHLVTTGVGSDVSSSNTSISERNMGTRVTISGTVSLRQALSLCLPP